MRKHGAKPILIDSFSIDGQMLLKGMPFRCRVTRSRRERVKGDLPSSVANKTWDEHKFITYKYQAGQNALCCDSLVGNAFSKEFNKKTTCKVSNTALAPKRMREVIKRRNASKGAILPNNSNSHVKSIILRIVVYIEKKTDAPQKEGIEVKEYFKKQKLQEIEDLHCKTVTELNKFSDLSVDLDLAFGIYSSLSLDIVKKQFLQMKDIREINEKCETNYSMAYEILLEKLKLNHESRLKKVLATLHNEMSICTKTMRYSLKNLLQGKSYSEHCYNVIIIDIIWKIMLLNMESLLEYEKIHVNKSTRKALHNLELLEEDQKNAISRLDLFEKKIKLDYTIKKEQHELQVQSVIKDKERLMEIIEGMKLQIEDLMDPSRFLNVHYFLTEFEHKFKATKELQIKRLNATKNLFHLMLNADNIEKELNDELSTADMRFPKYIIFILRKLQEQLNISGKEMRYKLKCIDDLIDHPEELGKKRIVNESIQTNPLKEFDFLEKVIVIVT